MHDLAADQHFKVWLTQLAGNDAATVPGLVNEAPPVVSDVVARDIMR